MKYNSRTKKERILAINMFAKENPAALIESAETAFHDQIVEVCDALVSQDKNIIMLAGPSSSGKTTMSIRLASELEARGKKSTWISMDNFYKNRDDVPFWRNGNRNFETIESLDLEYFRKLMKELAENKHAKFPIFDFSTGGRSDQTFDVTLDGDTCLVFEGIHALSPQMNDCIDGDRSIRIYMSVHSDFVNESGEVVLAGRDARLIRRILRDSWLRATTAVETLEFWRDVCRGEDKYIKPYRALADMHINSTHCYEPLLFRDKLLDILAVCDTEKFGETIARLRYGVSHFAGTDGRLVPGMSLLNEFIDLSELN